MGKMLFRNREVVKVPSIKQSKLNRCKHCVLSNGKDKKCNYQQFRIENNITGKGSPYCYDYMGSSGYFEYKKSINNEGIL